MKTTLLIALLTSLSFSDAISKECEDATAKATKIHWDYVHGKATYTQSENARKKMEKVCGL